jgi:hypothetical protein
MIFWGAVALPALTARTFYSGQGFYGVRSDFGDSLETYELDLSPNLLP